MRYSKTRLEPQEYCDDSWQKMYDYVQGVEDGSIVVGTYIKKVIKRYKDMLSMKDRFYYDTRKVDKVFKFFSFLNVEHKNKYIQPNLMPFQCFFIAFAFGFYHANDHEKRVVREVLLFMARKNGKTMISAALQLYFMLGDNVINPQSLLLANVSAQATIALNFAKSIVTHSPALHGRLVGQRSKIIFKDQEKQGFCQTFSTLDPARLEGYSPQCAICDEAHNYNDNAIPQAIKTGFGARMNPMLFIISTAGASHKKFLQEYIQTCKANLDGTLVDYSTFPMIFQPDTDDDLKDMNCWVKANPALEYILSLDDLEIAFTQAKNSKADQYFFITKQLNLFADSPSVWISEDELMPVFDNFFDETPLIGRDCYLGADLSKNTDLSSVVAYFPEQGDEPAYAIPYFFMANRPENTVRKNGKDLSNYLYDNWITKCDTKTIDLDLIGDKILELAQKFNVISFSYDPYNAPILVARLKENGMNCEKFAQNATKFGTPLKMLEEKVYKRAIKMKNPCLLWNFQNVVLYVDGNGNIKIVKNKQLDSVDGVVALGMAIGGWVQAIYGDEIIGLNQYIEAMRN